MGAVFMSQFVEYTGRLWYDKRKNYGVWKMEEKQNKSNNMNSEGSENNQCFVIMPISDPEGYEKGHFRYVYEDIFKPAIKDAGFKPKRADDDGSSSMIQVNIIKDIIESPMAICDLSTRNPNVLFELGIRQAFDLPVVLIQEEGTPRIFDINTINTIDYRSSLKYREVMEDRENISKAIEATKDNTTGVNSIIKLLEIGKAKLDKKESGTDLDDIKLLLFSLSNQVEGLKKKDNTMEIQTSVNEMKDLLQNQVFQEYKRKLFFLRRTMNENVSNNNNLYAIKNSITDVLVASMKDERLTRKQQKMLDLECNNLMSRINQMISKLEDE